jgi:hypothetical protein
MQIVTALGHALWMPFTMWQIFWHEQPVRPVQAAGQARRTTSDSACPCDDGQTNVRWKMSFALLLPLIGVMACSRAERSPRAMHQHFIKTVFQALRWSAYRLLFRHGP